MNQEEIVTDPADEKERIGTWDDTGYNLSDEEAHRDAVYSTPSVFRQICTVFAVQIKLFSKEKSAVMFLLALLIPVAFISGFNQLSPIVSGLGVSMETTNGMMALGLFMLPLILALLSSTTCGTLIPVEIKTRTAYMNFSLPISRTTFYIGKFLAGFVMCAAVFILAYAMTMLSIIIINGNADGFSSVTILKSLGITLVGVFAYTATAYCIGCNMSRGSSIVPFIIMGVILPMILSFAVVYINNNVSSPESLKPLSDLITMLPFYLGDAAINVLGSPLSCSAGVLIKDFISAQDIPLMLLIGIIWGIVFLLIGLFRTKRREM